MTTIKIDFENTGEAFFALARFQREFDVREIKGNGKTQTITAGKGKGYKKFRALKDKGIV